MKRFLIVVLSLLLVSQVTEAKKKEVTKSDSLLIQIASQKKIYDAYNEKAYLKQSYDTVAMFSTLDKIFAIAEELDSIDSRYRSKHAKFLDGYRKNIFFAGTYFINREEYRVALKYFERYLNCAKISLFASKDYLHTDTLMCQAAYWALIACNEMRNASGIVKHSELALKWNKREQVLACMFDAYRRMHDEEHQRQVLSYGLIEFPKSPFFLYAKSMQDLKDGNYDNAIEISDTLIHAHPDMPRPYFTAGLSCLRKIDRYSSSKDKKIKNELYQRALGYMEKYRNLAPQERRRWAPLLYRIYYNLNMDVQFKEMEKLMTNSEF